LLSGPSNAIQQWHALPNTIPGHGNAMKTPKHSLRKIVTFLNNCDEDGGFWMPNIQRLFVWSEEQMCRLFDSIMREHPISTLLIWKTKSKIRRRKFIDNCIAPAEIGICLRES
jgi:hypothetical protein